MKFQHGIVFRIRHNFCKKLDYDVLALTDFHNKQNKFARSKIWITSDDMEIDNNGKLKYQRPNCRNGICCRLSAHMGQKLLMYVCEYALEPELCGSDSRSKKPKRKTMPTRARMHTHSHTHNVEIFYHHRFLVYNCIFHRFLSR